MKIEKMKKIIKENSNIQVISADLFDTLLFRTVKYPVDVFELAGKRGKACRYIKEHIEPVEYKYVRIEAEKQARELNRERYNTSEVTLDEIYRCMPDNVCMPLEMKKIELDIEKEVCYANSEVLQLLQEQKREGKKIILISDMYLSKQELTALLHSSGIDNKLFDRIFVSSEERVSKAQGKLYSKVLAEMKNLPNEIIHIGDNYTSDILNAKELGIHTFYYDVISNEHEQFFELEELKYGNIAGEIYALRKTIYNQAEALNEEEKIWFRLGGCIIAPLLSAACEWVLYTAKKNSIKTIYPLMREGKILAELLSIANKKSNLKINIKPLYVSRKAMFLPSIKVFNKEILNQIYDIKDAKVADIFKLLKIEDLLIKFDQYKEISLKDLALVSVKDNSLKDEIEDFLFSEGVKNRIQKNIEDQQKIVFEYFKKMGMNERFITFDIGFKGTIQKGVESILNKYIEPNHNIHLLVLGANETIHNIFNGVDLRGYVGTLGANEKLINPVYWNVGVIEQFLMCNEGSTTGYIRNKDGQIEAEKQDIHLSAEQIKKVRIAQEGMLAYEKAYVELASQNNRIKGIEDKASELIKLVDRLYMLPTQEEAEKIGNLSHDENYGADVLNKICKTEDIELIKQEGIDAFIEHTAQNRIMWLEGAVTQADPAYYMEKLLDEGQSEYEKSILGVAKKVKKYKESNIAILGAGKAGKRLYSYLKMYHIPVKAFLDNNKKLHGQNIDNIPILPVEYQVGIDVIAIGSLAYINELTGQVKKEYGDSIKIIYHGCKKW